MKAAIRLTWAFPLLLLSGMYLTWFAARGVLGRWPRPMFDDPKTIHGGWMWLYNATGYLISWGTLLFFLGLIAIAAYVLFKRMPDWKRRIMDIGVSLVLFAALIGFALWDPHDVVYWFLD